MDSIGHTFQWFVSVNDSVNIYIYIYIYIYIVTQMLQPVFHNWCNKSHDMCYPVCEIVYIKEPLLLIEKSSP